MNPARIGATLSLTIGIGYAACTLLFWLMPEGAATFMSALFHGLDFRKLQAPGAIFGFQGFFYALLVMMAWSFALGALFAWVHGRLAPGKSG